MASSKPWTQAKRGVDHPGTAGDEGLLEAPEETATAINEEGWLHTGDIARMDEDGCTYIVDRKKDLIIASGYNIVPREVEEVLYMHESVLEATVAGVPDAIRGETVKAYIVLKAGQKSTQKKLPPFAGKTWHLTRCRGW